MLAGSPSCQDDWEPLFVVALDMCLLCVIPHEDFLLYMFWCCHMLIQYPLPVVVALVVIERQKMLGDSATACLDWCWYKVSVISIFCLAKQLYGLAALSPVLPLHCDCRWIVSFSSPITSSVQLLLFDDSTQQELAFLEQLCLFRMNRAEEY